MSSPEPQPKFFLDRSLGRVAVPALLRAAGWDLVTLAEHYGVPEDERVADPEWIREAAVRGWPILMKDKRIRYRQPEIDAVIQYQAQCFVITKGDLPSGEMASRLLTARQAIFDAVAVPARISTLSSRTESTSSTLRDPDWDRQDSVGPR